MFQDILRSFDIKLVSLANYLGISVDYIKSVNSGRRSLNGEDLLKLVPLWEALSSSTDELDPQTIFDTGQQEWHNERLKKRIAKKTRTIENKAFELEKIKKSYSDMLRGWQAFRKLEKADISDPHHKKWVKLHSELLCQKLKEHKLEISELQAQIKGLKAQKEAMIEELM